MSAFLDQSAKTMSGHFVEEDVVRQIVAGDMEALRQESDQVIDQAAAATNQNETTNATDANQNKIQANNGKVLDSQQEGAPTTIMPTLVPVPVPIPIPIDEGPSILEEKKRFMRERRNTSTSSRNSTTNGSKLTGKTTGNDSIKKAAGKTTKDPKSNEEDNLVSAILKNRRNASGGATSSTPGAVSVDGVRSSNASRRNASGGATSSTPGAVSVEGVRSSNASASASANVTPTTTAAEDARTATTDAIVSANVVNEEDLEAEYKQRLMKEMVEATEVKSDGKCSAILKKYKYLLILFAISAIGMSIVLGMVLGDGKDDNNGTDKELLPAITETPTPAPTFTVYEYLREMMLPISGEGSLDTEGTPQHDALLWLTHDAASYYNGSDNDDDPEGYSIYSADPRSLTERYILAVLYFSTDGPNWDDDLRFLSEHWQCEWPNLGQNETNVATFNEVDCDENGYIIKLRIENNSLNGTIPSELGALESIEILTLALNVLHGTLPSELSQLLGLTILQWVGNELTGTIPSEYSRLTRMKTMSFYNNQLTGAIPEELYVNMLDLEVLDLGGNDFTGTIPDFNTQSRISKIFMEGNSLTGTIPATIYAQPNLEILSLSKNQLSGTIRENIGALKELLMFWGDGNQLTGTIPTQIGMNRDLVQLTLQDNDFEGPIPSELAGLRELSRLDLGNNRLAGTIPQVLGDMEGLSFLTLASNVGLIGSVPMSFGNLESLELLQIHNTSLTEGLDEAYCNQTTLTTSIEADCGGDAPEIDCPCCTKCCVDGNDCELSVPAVCLTQAGKFESDVARAAECACSEDGTLLSCTDTGCESCLLNGDICAKNTNYGYRFNSATGAITDFMNTVKYTTKWVNSNITFEEPRDGSCSIYVNGEQCRSCGRLTCRSGFEGYNFVCDNIVEGGDNFNSCEEFGSQGVLEILYAFDESQLSGCPLLLQNL